MKTPLKITIPTKDLVFAQINSLLWDLEDDEWVRYNYGFAFRSILRSVINKDKNSTDLLKILQKNPSKKLKKVLNLIREYRKL